jgi:hypothetical protein
LSSELRATFPVDTLHWQRGTCSAVLGSFLRHQPATGAPPATYPADVAAANGWLYVSVPQTRWAKRLWPGSRVTVEIEQDGVRYDGRILVGYTREGRKFFKVELR